MNHTQPFRVGVLGLLLLSSAGCASRTAAGADAPAGSQQMDISPASARPPSRGPAANFAGSATITTLFAATDKRRAAAASVTFDPGARSAWHSHPAGQTLVVTTGSGWIQQWGGPKRTLNAGDVVWTPPGVKHWHGATATQAMTHIAIQEHVDGKVVSWMELVSDEEYRK
jgi:quercetin dioxygenase-like cupin family protein